MSSLIVTFLKSLLTSFSKMPSRNPEIPEARNLIAIIIRPTLLPWNLYTKSQKKLSSCFVSGTNPSCLRKFDIERIHLRKTPYTSHVISLKRSIKQFSRHLSMKPREESVPGDKTDPLRMCYVQRTSIWLFLSSHPISGRSITTQLGTKFVSALKISRRHDISTMNYIQKAPNKSFIFNSWRVKPVKRDIFSPSPSLFGTNSFSVLCTHLIDFNVAVRLRYECFSATYASCVLINFKMFSYNSKIEQQRQENFSREIEKKKTATRVSEENGKRPLGGR